MVFFVEEIAFPLTFPLKMVQGNFFCKFPLAHFPHIFMSKQISPKSFPLVSDLEKFPLLYNYYFICKKYIYFRVQNTPARRNFYRITLGFTKIFVRRLILGEYFCEHFPQFISPKFPRFKYFPQTISPKNVKPKISPKSICPKNSENRFPLK